MHVYVCRNTAWYNHFKSRSIIGTLILFKNLITSTLYIYICIVVGDLGQSMLWSMVVGFTTTYAIGAYHHWCSEFESHSGQGVQHYMIKLVCDLQQVVGFLWVLWFPPPIKLSAIFNWNIVESGIKHHKTNQPLEIHLSRVVSELRWEVIFFSFVDIGGIVD